MPLDYISHLMDSPAAKVDRDRGTRTVRIPGLFDVPMASLHGVAIPRRAHFEWDRDASDPGDIPNCPKLMYAFAGNVSQLELHEHGEVNKTASDVS